MKYLVELTFFLYGLYLLNEAQYITFLILLVLATILMMKGIHHKESLVITIVFLLFITQYHRYFPYREDDTREHFRNNDEFEDEKYKAEKAERRKKRKERKKLKKRLEVEMDKNNAGLPIQYIKNNLKIKEKSKSWGDALSKWYLFKENFMILLND
jgi:hypothetical protein